MIMQNNRAGRLEELNYFNAVSCLLVILIHVLSLGITGLDRTSWQLTLIYFPWKLAAFVVPAFLFSGAVKMAIQFESSSLSASTPRKKICSVHIKTHNKDICTLCHLRHNLLCHLLVRGSG